MRYGLIPQSPREEAALEHAPHARLLLEPFLPVVAARAVMAFVRLGLARALATEGKSAAELASELGLRKDGLEHLLRVLAASGYVSMVGSGPGAKSGGPPESDERFELTELSRITLLQESPARLDAWVIHNAVHWRVISKLEETLSGDGARDLHHHLESPEEWATYQRAMMQTARPAADAVAQMLPEPDYRGLLLDLGGSHGLYGAAICRRLPPMRCRVLDLPEALVHARALGEEEGICELVEYMEGDIVDTDLGEETCDVAFLGNIVHHLDDENLAGLLSRVRRALRPGGVVAIWDMAPPPDQPEPDLVAEGFSLMFYLSSASACRSPDAHVRALEEAGFVNDEVRRGLSPTHVLVTAER